MKKQMIDPHIMSEEAQTLKWFLIFFYIISISFDIIFNFITIYFPQLSDQKSNSLTYLLYLIMFALIPVALYLVKKQKLYYIKYIYFISYTLITLVADLIDFIGDGSNYKGGNAGEIFWLLLAPVFVSKRFMIVVSVGLILKYVILGLAIKAPIVFIGILLVTTLSILAFVLLSRFQAYVNAIKTSYDQQLTGIVKGVIATLELKDPYTRGHSERVASYALELAKTTGKYTEEELKSFEFACLLHDIGKIHIPDQILMKPTKLTTEEYEIIKSHTNVGAEAVSKVIQLNSSIEVIRSHHERWDGKGYPDQLKGDDIPFLARIAAVADAFDAMTSNRSYRNALSVDEAYKRIIEGKGTQFDPELVDLFQQTYPIWKKLHDKTVNELNGEISHSKIPAINLRR
ncbi:putative nucleotidyltransferase with HDIG domain [Bacillus sp. SORGH_AS 510]|uniref:HD-GYP domain-containing protein n=1 Tax=Bacillus sp. SORGH_AS_0510 TaxID=3041771 RepID=UPI002788183D|nr:HD-GYP domain-containing protein [Bacillus sp. SORGH_AS_0510]MDQ1147488.1 putative nucleotidyltransferase with HDIG domain [Bacillus sp. SORGH_AS_0510]